MNILPKKRWHVRTKQNIERVRRDEAKAAEEEKELQRRIRLAEQEARTDLLRKKAKSSTSETEHEFSRDDHVNFFKELEEEGGHHGGINKEHEAEEKAQKEKFEKDIGLLTYLGQSSSEAKGEIPWYLKAETKDILTGTDSKDETASLKHKSKLDPLNDMKKYLTLKEKKHGKLLFTADKEKIAQSKDESKSKVKSDKRLSKIEELRAKRLKREAEEKKRSQNFLENLRKGTSEKEPAIIMDDRLRQYNSQFNPHLARNNLASTKNYDVV
ncbi:leukocyte receptor cluster member 1 homolog [Uloborus diversus]|uniref:leukocyte receptor cluster member 1 homolog n=1 Tax=Uloborus diversus TaxID=327109 RepID=UPI002409207B|nr:leukocyte receptor cluster member 1 homolog [Uloborus diversus]